MLLGAELHPDSVIVTSIAIGVAAAEWLAADESCSLGAVTDAQLARAKMAVRVAIDVFMGSPFRPKTNEHPKSFT
jgi:hypothetical protein